MRPRPLLALLILIWAVSWPVIKVGVGVVPPIWFACLRYAIATGVLVAIGAARGTLRFPSRADRRLVLVSGVLQMAAYAALTALALTKLPAGRASVLAFSTPLWVVPLAVLRRQERLAWRAALGVVIGLVGIVVIALPSLLGGGARLAPAYAMLIAAAAAWAVSIVFVREHRFEAGPDVLAPWQTLVASVILFPIAIATEGALPPIGTRALLSLAYVGPVATAFAYWAIVDVGRRLPASTLSVALLATPSLGLLISALTLGESVNASLIVGMVLVGAGIRLSGPSRRSRRSRAQLPHPLSSRPVLRGPCHRPSRCVRSAVLTAGSHSDMVRDMRHSLHVTGTWRWSWRDERHGGCWCA